MGVTPSRVEAARVSPLGILLDSAPVVLGNGSDPAVARGGGTSLVAWDAATGIVAVTIDPGGTLNPSVVFSVADEPQDPMDPMDPHYFGHPAVASNGTGFLVGYDITSSQLNPPEQHTIQVTTVSGGQATGSVALGGGLHPSIASNGTDYLVAWTQCVVIDCEFRGDTDISTRRVSPGLALSPIVRAATGPAQQTESDIAWNEAGTSWPTAARRAAEGRLTSAPLCSTAMAKPCSSAASSSPPTSTGRTRRRPAPATTSASSTRGSLPRTPRSPCGRSRRSNGAEPER